MSLNLYDEALVNKLRNWTKDTQIQVYAPNETKELFQVIADTTNDKSIKLPIIAISRGSGFTILNVNKKPMTFDGLTLEANNEIAKQLNSIPISIPYQLDVYTRYLNESDQYVRNLVFNIINYPKLDINIPYNNENYIHHANIRLQNEVSDTSDIPQRLVKGQFTRTSLRLDIDDAYLWDVRYRDVYSIELSVEVKDD